MRSQTVRWQGQEGSGQFKATALIASCIYWRHMMQTFLRLNHRYPDRTMFLRYEDFVRAPEETINSALIYAAGEAMPFEDLKAAIAQFRHKNKHEKDRVSVEPEVGIDQRPLERWRRMLSDAEIDLVSALTWRTARKLGYDVSPPRRSVPIVKALPQLGARKSLEAVAKIAYLGMLEPFTSERADGGARIRQS
jgi:hypothetical protein